jgi:DNA repair exonuclease SbcCD nuclease subunit
MTSVQYASDLHLDHLAPNIEFKSIITPSAPILVLAGDIASVWNTVYNKFIGWCSMNWRHVILVAGNHEYFCHSNYPHSRQDTELRLQLFSHIYYNVHYLQAGQTYIIPKTKIVFIGATLYSNINPEIYDEILVKSDFTKTFVEQDNLLIRTHPKDHVAAHKRHRQALADAIRAVPRNYKVVVVTHYLPTHKLLEPEYRDDRWRSCYASKDDDLFRLPVTAWICGHGHRTAHIHAKHNILVAMNARGYKQYELNRTVDVYQPTLVFIL